MSSKSNERKPVVDPKIRYAIGLSIIAISVFFVGVVLWDHFVANVNISELAEKTLVRTDTVTTVTFPNGTEIITETHVLIPTKEELTQLNTIINEEHQANQNLLTPIMTAVSAWIGAIIAFYFGKDYLMKLAESNKELADSNTELAQNVSNKLDPKITKFSDLVRENPNSLKVENVELTKDTTVKQIDSSIDTHGNTFLYSTDQDVIKSPWGIVYKSDWNAVIFKMMETIQDSKSKVSKELNKSEIDIDSLDDEIDQELQDVMIKEDVGNEEPLDIEIDEKLLDNEIEETESEDLRYSLSVKEGILKQSEFVDKVTKKKWADEPIGFSNFVLCKENDEIADKMKEFDKIEKPNLSKALILNEKNNRILAIYDYEYLDNLVKSKMLS